MMAGLVESVRWRTPQSGRGGRYLLATLSDASGQYMASCYDEAHHGDLEAAAAANDVVLTGADMLWRVGEETTRIAIRSLTPLAASAEVRKGDVRISMKAP